MKRVLREGRERGKRLWGWENYSWEEKEEVSRRRNRRGYELGLEEVMIRREE